MPVLPIAILKIVLRLSLKASEKTLALWSVQLDTDRDHYESQAK
ncbi:hypothetical protein RLON56S_02761 [Alishewanella longhuensis]